MLGIQLSLRSKNIYFSLKIIYVIHLLIMNYLKKLSFLVFETFFLLPNLKNSDKKKEDYLIINNDSIKSLTNFLNEYLSRKQDKIKNKISEIHSQGGYYFHINDILDDDCKNRIIEVLSNKTLLENISSSFGYKIKFTSFVIRINFFNEKLLEEEGPKMWHRDNDSLFGQLKLFLVINKLNSVSDGQFYFIPQKTVPSYIKLYSEYNKNENFSDDDKNSRIKNIDILEKYNLDSSDIKSYGLNNEEALVLNTNDTYHKGGYLKDNQYYRILLQAIYEPKNLSISNYNKYSKNILYRNLKNILTGFKNRLRQNLSL